MSSSRKLCPLPGPSGYPIVGNLPHLRGDEMLWEKLEKIRKTHGDIFLLHLGWLKMMVVCGHKHVKKLLTEKSESFKYRPQWLVEVTSLKLSQGIVWSNGLQTTELRKFTMPALFPGLGPETLEQRVQTEATHIVEQIANTECLNSSDQLKELIYRAVCNINCGVIFGERFNYTDPEFSELLGIMDQLLIRHGVKNTKNFFPILQIFPHDRKTKHLISVISKLKAFLLKHLAKAEETFDPQKLRGLLDLFIARKQDVTSTEYKVSEDNLTHICRDIFVAGTENVAYGVLWLIAYCLKYKDVFDKCRRNITEVVGDSQTITAEDVKKMTYVQATINEVLRTTNITPLSVPHATIEEAEFEGYSIPKQTMVLTHVVSVHNDPDFWDNPDSFNPDRFIDPDGTLIEKEAFYPFSIGPRYCLAKHLARVDMSIFFVTILRNLDMTSSDQEPSLKQTQPGAFVEPETFGVKFTRISSDEK